MSYKYNIQFEDEDIFSIVDELWPNVISTGDKILLKNKLYSVEATIHNFEDGKSWLIVR